MKNILTLKFIFLMLFLTFTSFGCIATREDFLNLKLEMFELRKEINEGMNNTVEVNIDIRDEIIEEIERLKKINADLRENINLQNNYINKIGGKIDAGNYKFDDLKFSKDSLEQIDKKLAILEDKLTKLWMSPNLTQPQTTQLQEQNQPQPAPTSILPTPQIEQIYEVARTDYGRGSYDLAIAGFTKLKTEVPDTLYGENSNYDLAVCYYAKKDWAKTCETIDEFAIKYPNNDLIRKAYLLKAKALRKLGEFEKAKEVYNKLMKGYPSTEEAKSSKDELDSMNDATKNK